MPSPEEQQAQAAAAAPPQDARPVSEAQPVYTNPQTRYSQPYYPQPQQPPKHYPAPNGVAPYSQVQQYADFEKLRTPPPFSQQWHTAKMVLGGASIVCSTVLVAIGIAIATLYSGLSYGLSDLIAVVVTAGIALIWQTAENITICARSAHRGIHPGAHVGLHLVIWLAGITSTIIIAICLSMDAVDLNQYSNCDSNNDGTSNCGLGDSYYGGYGYSTYGGVSLSDARQYVGMEAALVAFVFILTIIHFVLFVRACVETHQRNRSPHTVVVVPQGTQLPSSSSRVVYMPMPPEMAHMSYAQPQQMQQQQMQPTYQGYNNNRMSGPEYYAPMAAPPQSYTREKQPNNDASLHGYYSPTASHASQSYLPTPVDGYGRPESSVMAPSPVSEAGPVDKGKGREVVPEQGEASGSGTYAL